MPTDMPTVFTVELCQTITKYLPKKRFSQYENMDGVAYKEKSFQYMVLQSVRTTVMRISEKISIEDIEIRMLSYPTARIRQTLSSEPIITEDLQTEIRLGETTYQKIKEEQLIRYSAGHADAGKPVLYFGNRQYGHLGFKREAEADIDIRLTKKVTT